MVKQWKDEKIYPYEGEAVNPLESVERQVFDVCAVNVNAPSLKSPLARGCTFRFSVAFT